MQESPETTEATANPTRLRAGVPVAIFDYLRVPYDVDCNLGGEAALVRIDAARQQLCWPAGAVGMLGSWALGDMRIFGRLADDELAASLLGPEWRAAEAVLDAGGSVRGHVWRSSRGVFLPFDPNEAALNLITERYTTLAGSALASGSTRVLRRLYYRARPLLPRPVQIGMRRAFTSVQQRSSFPRWPVETSFHDLLDLVLGLVGDATGSPVPWIAPWPKGYTSAVVLTHDVELAVGYEHIHLLRDIELDQGFRSSWNLVPRRYTVHDAAVAELTTAGFEVGVHGLFHDGRDLESASMLERRLPEIREWAARWNAIGFRSPATHRSWELMPRLGFDYDSSYPDSDPYEPVAGGCCSWFPFMNGDLVELPITLPQDHTLYEILRVPALEHWRSKADAVRERSGMALLITHPDYMLDDERLEDYRGFLAHVGSRDDIWKALPREVSAWWRRRASSSVVVAEGEWSIAGPASEEGDVATGPLRTVTL